MHKKFVFPGIGMRNIKTALAASICAIIYLALGKSPAFACIGAIFGMGSDMADSRKNGGNRLFGTLIGVCWACCSSGSTSSSVRKADIPCGSCR